MNKTYDFAALASAALRDHDFPLFDLFCLAKGEDQTALLEGAELEPETRALICSWAKKEACRRLEVAADASEPDGQPEGTQTKPGMRQKLLDLRREAACAGDLVQLDLASLALAQTGEDVKGLLAEAEQETLMRIQQWAREQCVKAMREDKYGR